MTARELALAVVRDVFPREGRARSAHEAFDYRARRSGLDERDRAFAAELAYGTIKARRFLDWVLAPHLGARAATLPPAIGEILRLGTYQMRAMSVEPRAAVSESVGLAKKYGHRGTAGLVNAVLRRVSEGLERVPLRDEFSSDDDFIATVHSFPTWIVSALREACGSEHLEEMLRGMNAQARTALRANLLKTTPGAVMAELRERGVDATASDLVAEIVLIGEHGAGALRTDEAHRWEQQGEIAAVAVDVLDPQPNERILDLCSGRGNKSLQIAARIGDRGEVESIERDARKVAGETARLTELGVTSVRVLEADATEPRAPADRVLLDAPCSGIGILGRQPEARWRKDAQDAEHLSGVQAAMLEAAARGVRPGGRLVYSVCSVDAREGRERIAALLASDESFARGEFPERYAAWRTAEGDLLFPPGMERRDGFFVSVLERGAA